MKKPFVVLCLMSLLACASHYPAAGGGAANSGANRGGKESAQVGVTFPPPDSIPICLVGVVLPRLLIYTPPRFFEFELYHARASGFQ